MEALEQLTLFTEASLNLAKTSASLASKGDYPASAPASGSRCLELFPNSDPLTSLLRMCVERAISPCQPSSPVWKEKATKCGQASFQLLHLEPRTSVKDSSSSESGAMWLTPSVEDGGRNGSQEWAQKWANGETPPTCHQRLRTQVLASGLLPQSTETTTAAD